jgi:hypothetical protein
MAVVFEPLPGFYLLLVGFPRRVWPAGKLGVAPRWVLCVGFAGSLVLVLLVPVWFRLLVCVLFWAVYCADSGLLVRAGSLVPVVQLVPADQVWAVLVVCACFVLCWLRLPAGIW